MTPRPDTRRDAPLGRREPAVADLAREVLAAMRASDAAVYASVAGFGEELRTFLDAFAREHGLEPPTAGGRP